MLAFLFVVLTWIALIAVCVPFIRTLKSDAPEVYRALGEPTVSQFAWKKAVLIPVSGMILSRQYREELTNHPRARAWASWLFVLHWLYIVAVLIFVLGILGSVLTRQAL